MYFAYALGQLGVRCHALDGLGAMQHEQKNWFRPDDLLIATTFHPYAEETRQTTARAVQSGTPVVLITDSDLCPLAPQANTLFIVRDADVHSFRSLTSTLCLAQTLCIALGYARERDQPAHTAKAPRKQ